MKQFLLIICGIALLASCGKLGVTTYTVVNETDDEVFISVVQYDSNGSDLGTYMMGTLPAHTESDRIEPVFGTVKIKVSGNFATVSGFMYNVTSDIIILKPSENTKVYFR
jgi:hypothetical protein